VQASDRRRTSIGLALEGCRERAIRCHADVHAARELERRLPPFAGERRERQRAAQGSDGERTRRVRRSSRKDSCSEHDARRRTARQHVLDTARKLRTQASRMQRGLDQRQAGHRPIDSIS
jgi:hypothetical protein